MRFDTQMHSDAYTYTSRLVSLSLTHAHTITHSSHLLYNGDLTKISCRPTLDERYWCRLAHAIHMISRGWTKCIRFMKMCVHINTHIHTYIHTYIHIYRHKDISYFYSSLALLYLNYPRHSSQHRTAQKNWDHNRGCKEWPWGETIKENNSPSEKVIDWVREKERKNEWMRERGHGVCVCVCVAQCATYIYIHIYKYIHSHTGIYTEFF